LHSAELEHQTILLLAAAAAEASVFLSACAAFASGSAISRI
jgi:hypothetical protein